MVEPAVKLSLWKHFEIFAKAMHKKSIFNKYTIWRIFISPCDNKETHKKILKNNLNAIFSFQMFVKVVETLSI